MQAARVTSDTSAPSDAKVVVVAARCISGSGLGAPQQVLSLFQEVYI